jgi:cysteine rich repeat protein
VKWSTLLILGMAAGTPLASAQQASGANPALLNQLRSACQADVQKLCPNVQPGGGRIVDCLAQHKDDVSTQCKQAILQARQTQTTGQGQAQGQNAGTAATPNPAQAPGQGQGQQNKNLPPTAGFSP